MSGKTARRLRRLTEQAMNAPQGSTRAAHNNGEYKEHPVMRKDTPANANKAAMTATIRLDRKDPRAFYKEAKRMYKTGEAKAEADRMDKEYREEKKAAAKRIADKIAGIVEGSEPTTQVTEEAKPVFKVKFSDWLGENQHPLAAYVPFDIQATPEDMHAGIVTAVAKDETTGRTSIFKINKDGEFAVKQETEIESWRKFVIGNFNNDLDEFYKAVADEVHTLLHLLAEPVTVN